MKALSLLVRKLWPRLKFFKSKSNFKVKVMRSKIMKVMAEVKVFVYAANADTDAVTDANADADADADTRAMT